MLRKLLPLFLVVINLHAGWSYPPLPVSDRNEGDLLPLVCCNNEGKAFAIWIDSVGGLFDIQVSVYDGTSWSSEQTISQSPTVSGAGTYDICCDDTGHAIAIWRSRSGASNTIFVSSYDGTNWSAPFSLMTADNLMETPLICCSNSGKAIATWVQNPGAGNVLRSSFFDGTNWILNPTAVSPTTLSSIVSALCCQELDNNLNAVAVWRNNVNIITAAQFNGSTWSGATSLSTASSQTPSVCCDGSGHAVAAWHNSTLSQVQASYFNGATWQNTGVSAFVLATGTISNPFVRVCCYNNTANAIWTNSTTATVQASHFDGSAWSPTPFNLSTGTLVAGQIAAICCDSLFGAVSVWTQSASGIFSVYSSHFNGSSWTEAERISELGVSSSGADVCCNDLGNAVALWIAGGSVQRIVSAFYTNLFPVTNFRACSFINRTATQSATSVILSWTATINPLIPAYRIYRNGVLIATVPASVTSYKNCLINPCETNTFTIVTIDAVGNESSPTTIVL